MNEFRRLINIVSKNDSNRVLTENKDERKADINNVIATAERMIERYRDSNYTAYERAGDHAMSYDRDHPHQKYWLDVQNEIGRIENEQKNVTEGSEGTLWRVERSEATGRYYVVKGYNKSRKIWKNKMGVGDFVDRKSAESKADELNKGVTEGTLKICSDKNPKLIGFTLKDLDRLSESAGSNFSKFDLALKKNLNLPKWTNTLELYGVYLRKLSESKTGKLLKEGHQSSVEKTLFKELSQRSIGSIDSAKVGDKVSLLHLTTLNIPGHKVVARLNGFLTPKEIVNIKNSGSFQQLEFSDGSRYPEKDGGDIFQQTQGWNMTKLFPTYESASKAYTLYALMGKKLSDELDFQTNIEQGVTEAKSPEEFIAQLKSLAQKPPRITNTCRVCGKKWQLQHHCKGPSKNQDKGVAEEKLITQHKPGKCTQCGGPSYDDEQLAEEKDACYRKVKSRYRVWPSAYASGALVKCRRVGAKNWGNKSKKK